MRRHEARACALAIAFLLTVASTALAVPFTVTNGDFAGNQYTFSYFTTQNLSVNGANPGVVGDPWLTNNGWQRFAIGGFAYWQLPPVGLGITTSANATGTVGFDFSGVTAPIQKVEVLTANILFQIPQGPFGIGARSLGDVATGDVATPGVFGAGPYSNIYTLTGDGGATDIALGNGGPGDFNTRALTDITSLLSPAWLASPSLLELKFDLTQDPNGLDIFSDTAQVFRTLSTHTGTLSDNDLGLRLVVTLQDPSTGVPEPATVSLLLAGLAAVGVRQRRSPSR